MANGFRLLASLVTSLCIGIGAASSASAQAGARPQVEKTVLADGIYLFRVPLDSFGSGRGNSVVIVNEDDVLVFDSNMRPSSAEAVIVEIRKLTKNPVRTLVNSHWHQDHWTGNGVYAREFPGLRIIATEETRDYMANLAPMFALGFEGALKRHRKDLERGIRTGRKEDGKPFTAGDRMRLEAAIQARVELSAETSGPRTLPNFVYRNSLTFWSGKREIRLLSMNGDAAASTVLYLPAEKIMLVGDLIVHPNQWGNNGYHLQPWIEDLRRLRNLDAATIVPGHGPAFRDSAYLSLVIELFDTVRNQVRAALAEGAISLAQVKEQTDLSAVQAKFDAFPADFDGDGLIEMAYREARDGMLISSVD